MYLVDTTGYLGRAGEGTNELHTNCSDGQTINWSVVPVDPNTNIGITGFSGQMVDDHICTPQEVTAPGGTYWSAIVESQGQAGQQQYTVGLSADGVNLPGFDPFLQIDGAAGAGAGPSRSGTGP